MPVPVDWKVGGGTVGGTGGSRRDGGDGRGGRGGEDLTSVAGAHHLTAAGGCQFGLGLGLGLACSSFATCKVCAMRRKASQFPASQTSA